MTASEVRNVFDIILMQRFYFPGRAICGKNALSRHFLNLLFGGRNAQFTQRGRHLNGVIELFHGINAGERRFLVGGLWCHIQNLRCKTGEPGVICIADISGPTAPDGGQARAMRHIEQAAQFMLHLMSGPIAMVAAAVGQAVMRQAAGPHDLGACVVIIRVLHYNQRIADHGLHQSLSNAVRNFHASTVVKVAFHGMHEDVHAAAGCLIGWKRHGQLRVHNRKYGSAIVAAVTALYPAILIGDNGGLAHLASRCGNGQNCSDGKAALGLTLKVIKIPHIAAIEHAVSNGFRRIDHTAAAHGEDKIDALTAGKFNALINQRKTRIGYHSAQFNVCNAGSVQRLLHAIQQAGSAGAVPAVMDQDLFASLRLDQFTDLFLRFAAKDHFRRGIVDKIFHRCVLSFSKFIMAEVPQIFFSIAIFTKKRKSACGFQKNFLTKTF